MVLFRAITSNQKLDHLSSRLALIKGLTEPHGPAVSWPVYRDLSTEPTPKRLIEWHFLKKIHASGKKRPNLKSSVFCVLGKRAKTVTILVPQTVKQSSVCKNASRSTTQN
jgi:hypothetical protein